MGDLTEPRDRRSSARPAALSAARSAQRLRNHPSVFTFQWSDNEPDRQAGGGRAHRVPARGLRRPVHRVGRVQVLARSSACPARRKVPTTGFRRSYWYDTHALRLRRGQQPDQRRRRVGPGQRAERRAHHPDLGLDAPVHVTGRPGQAVAGPEARTSTTPIRRPGTRGYNFGTLYNFDTALSHRYGAWTGCAQYVEEAQVQNYEDVRAQFEAFIDHWTRPRRRRPARSTGC